MYSAGVQGVGQGKWGDLTAGQTRTQSVLCVRGEAGLRGWLALEMRVTSSLLCVLGANSTNRHQTYKRIACSQATTNTESPPLGWL